MIDYDLDTAHSIVVVRPQAPLGKDDFVKLAKAVDPQIESSGDLAGVIIDARSFPGWENFGSVVSHFRFVRDHQKHVKKVAVITGLTASVINRIPMPHGKGSTTVSVSAEAAGDTSETRAELRWGFSKWRRCSGSGSAIRHSVVAAVLLRLRSGASLKVGCTGVGGRVLRRTVERIARRGLGARGRVGYCSHNQRRAREGGYRWGDSNRARDRRGDNELACD
jgi:hypothetical protein